jgi:hypothetical protein
MTEPLRVRVAAIVAAAATGRRVSAVDDRWTGRHWTISVTADGGVVGYDHATGTRVSGTGTGRLDFYDYGTVAHIRLALRGPAFSGHDFRTGRRFSGSVRGPVVSLFDHETGRSYVYQAAGDE